MNVLVVVFWICFAIVGGTYVGYPLLVGVWARLFGRPVDERWGFNLPSPPGFAGGEGTGVRGDSEPASVSRFREGYCPPSPQPSPPAKPGGEGEETPPTARVGPSFTVLLAAHNEENNIERRIAELRRHIAATGLDGELIVVADGCSDRTASRAEGFGDVRVLAWPENRGKAAALSAGAAEATGDILVFADVRQTWADDAIVRMLGNFADPAVGAVSGDLVLESEPGVLAGVGLYWRFEKWLRRQESHCWSQVGVTGAIAATRRELFEPIPDGTVLDDVCWPLRIAMRGHRVIHDESAVAFDRLPEKPLAEFRRKVRTLAGNLQLAATIPASLLPWRNRVWPAWIGHKLARLVVPWALIGLLATSALIDSPWALGFAALQAACYLTALAGLTPWLGRNRLAGAAASFLVLNAAAWCAFWVWATGRTAASWRKVDYRRTVLVPTNEVPT